MVVHESLLIINIDIHHPSVQYYGPMDTNIISLYIIVHPKFIYLIPVCYCILQFKHVHRISFTEQLAHC